MLHANVPTHYAMLPTSLTKIQIHCKFSQKCQNASSLYFRISANNCPRPFVLSSDKLQIIFLCTCSSILHYTCCCLTPNFFAKWRTAALLPYSDSHTCQSLPVDPSRMYTWYMLRLISKPASEPPSLFISIHYSRGLTGKRQKIHWELSAVLLSKHVLSVQKFSGSKFRSFIFAKSVWVRKAQKFVP